VANSGSISVAPEVAAVAAELAKVPKSDAAVTWNATAQGTIETATGVALTAYDPPTKTEMDTAHALLATPAQVNAQVDAALDTAIPGTPTTGSMNEVVKGLGNVRYLGPSGYSLSSVVLVPNDAEKNVPTPAGYVKAKEILCPLDATLRIYFELYGPGVGGTVYGKIYKNGGAFGTGRSRNVESWLGWSEDLAFVPGDLIQLYVNDPNDTHLAKCRYFRVLGAWTKDFVNNLV